MRPPIRTFQHRGSALLEFAIGFAVLIPLVVGAVQYAAAFLQLGQLDAAVGMAAREVSHMKWESRDAKPAPELLRTAQNLVLYGKATEGTSVSVPGLRPENIRLSAVFERGIPAQVEVSITGFVLPLPGGARHLDGKPSAIFPFSGLYDPQ